MRKVLSVLAEVVQSTALRLRQFLTLTDTGDNQYQDGSDVRQHIIDLRRHTRDGYIQTKDLQSTEDQTAQQCAGRAPGGEDNQSNSRQP